MSGTATSLTFSASLSRDFLEGSSFDYGTIETFSGVTAIPVNAPGAVTYEWTLVSGSALILPTSPLSATTYFSSYFPAFAGSRTAVYRCDVTSGGTTVSSGSVTIVLSTNSGGEI